MFNTIFYINYTKPARLHNSKKHGNAFQRLVKAVDPSGNYLTIKDMTFYSAYLFIGYVFCCHIGCIAIVDQTVAGKLSKTCHLLCIFRKKIDSIAEVNYVEEPVNQRCLLSEKSGLCILYN